MQVAVAKDAASADDHIFCSAHGEHTVVVLVVGIHANRGGLVELKDHVAGNDNARPVDVVAFLANEVLPWRHNEGADAFALCPVEGSLKGAGVCDGRGAVIADTPAIQLQRVLQRIRHVGLRNLRHRARWGKLAECRSRRCRWVVAIAIAAATAGGRDHGEQEQWMGKPHATCRARRAPTNVGSRGDWLVCKPLTMHQLCFELAALRPVVRGHLHPNLGLRDHDRSIGRLSKPGSGENFVVDTAMHAVRLHGG